MFSLPNKTFYSNLVNLDEFTDLGEKCLDSKCGKGKDQFGNDTSYNWCYKESMADNKKANFSDTWDYCTPRSGFFFFHSFIAKLVFQYDLPKIWQTFDLVFIMKRSHIGLQRFFSLWTLHYLTNFLLLIVCLVSLTRKCFSGMGMIWFSLIFSKICIICVCYMFINSKKYILFFY